MDATDLAYLLVVLEITGYAIIYSVVCAAPGLKPIWLPPQTFRFEFRSIDFLYNFPCQSIRLTQTESQRPDGGLIRNLGARALLLMRGQASALEPLRTSRRGHQRRATRVSLARIVQQRRAHEPAHGPLESGARHSRDLRGGPREGAPLVCHQVPCVDT